MTDHSEDTRSEYTTYTIVVRNHTDVIGKALDLDTEGVEFVWAEDGVSSSAFALGAEPSTWDESIEITCERLYEQGGASRVYSFVQRAHPDVPWSLCEPCDTGTPHMKRDDTQVCLVCGTHKEA